MVALAAAVPIWAKVPGLPLTSGARSILNPVSIPELSFQLRLIWLEETAVAVRVLGDANDPALGCGTGIVRVAGVGAGIVGSHPVPVFSAVEKAGTGVSSSISRCGANLGKAARAATHIRRPLDLEPGLNA